MTSPAVIEPNPEQLRNCLNMGWEYLGDGYFTKDGKMGWFTNDGWHKE